MILSELVASYNRLCQLNYAETWQPFSLYLKHIGNTIDIDSIAIDINSCINRLESSIRNEREIVFKQILEEEKSLLNIPYKAESLDFVIKWNLYMPENHWDIIKSRITQYTNWKYPGLLIRPRRSEIINIMVAQDPLYLADHHDHILDTCISTFPLQYQNRLRTYVIPQSGSVLDSLPDGQYGLCVAFEFFDFKPMNHLEAYLREIFLKLRPGGSICFSFNDCDKESAVKLAESGFCEYTPGRLVINCAKDIGFVPTFKLSHPEHAITWIEFQKPGILTSIKGGQCFTKIL